MPRNILQDVVVKNERGIRQIPIPERDNRDHGISSRAHHGNRKESTHATREREISTKEHEEEVAPPRTRRKQSSFLATLFSSRQPLKLFLVLVVIAVFVSAVVVISRPEATVTLYPKKYVAVINEKAVAKLHGAGTVLGYELASQTLERAIIVPATGQKEVEKRSEGTIVIYNNYAATTQRLIVNTRFETPNGLVFRLIQTAVVPGRTTRNGKIIPGSIEAKVRADAPGTKYNIGLTDFTVPGFKGTPRYDGFYARSKTPMSGGYIGTIKVVDEKLVATKRTELRASLEKEARTALLASADPLKILYVSTVAPSFETLEDNSSSKDTASLREKITVTGMLFDRKNLSSYLASKSVDSFSGGEVLLDSIETLTASATRVNGVLPESTAVSFSGKGTFVSVIYSEQIQSVLAGKPKKSFNEALLSIPGISTAEASVRPIWSSTFPKNAVHIKVSITLD